MSIKTYSKLLNVNLKKRFASGNIYYVKYVHIQNPLCPPFYFMLGQGVKKYISAILSLGIAKRVIEKIFEIVKCDGQKKSHNFFLGWGGCDGQ